MAENVHCPDCGSETIHLIGRLYKCNSCKAFVKNWPEGVSRVNGAGPDAEEHSSAR
ncbi:MAG: hypothetical protein M3198_17310 [Actinomycetota bacterium]|nr:hypothetical protein [Actinomycetota bacterium]